MRSTNLLTYLLTYFEIESHGDFHNYLRMEPAMFHNRTNGACSLVCGWWAGWARCLSE